MGGERQVIRELEHALSDLRHDAFPGYASTWQDDIQCAADHIDQALTAIKDVIATFPKQPPLSSS